MNPEITTRNERKLLQVKQYVLENLREDLSAATVAARFSISVSTLLHLFSKNPGRTYKEFVIEARMQKAVELLTTTHLSVKEILSATGYRDRSAFNKCFKKKFLHSPLHFRK